MEQSKFCKRFMLWTAIIVAVVMLVIGLVFGKVIEDNLFQEVTKWIFGSIGIICIFEVFAYILAPLFWHGSKYDPSSEKYKKAQQKKNK